ncbi:hypothetical protein [Mangrovivirga cuniculi]|uniref:GNAT family N-acetyltransferase n=1 Tax=Mangrovivirga cuniculi TaxID=2715131 RepID=A0A4D7JJL6_9BACT|nr:hypothetical protein [Mangrovivirga cuniculi]QCK15791.1 hypothetical protein DCC35_14065 [Mangrovivirga cuniculi]
MTFREVKSNSLLKYESSILDLIGEYYDNPKEVLEMISQERKVYMAIDNQNKISSILTCKTHNLNGIIFSYLGLLVSNSKNKLEIGALMFRHLEYLYQQQRSNTNKLFCYALTSSVSAYNWVLEFYDNVFPQNDSMLKHIAYKEILKISGYKTERNLPYKVINSPSVAKYKSGYSNLISRNNKIERFPIGFDINESKGERVLIMCDLPEKMKFEKLKTTYCQHFV